MNIQEIKKGIVAYKKQQGQIINFIKQRGGRITADEFESKFCAEQLYPATVSEESFIISPFWTNLCQWRYLLLLMVEAKILKKRHIHYNAKSTTKVIYYYLTKKCY